MSPHAMSDPEGKDKLQLIWMQFYIHEGEIIINEVAALAHL